MNRVIHAEIIAVCVFLAAIGSLVFLAINDVVTL